MIADYLIIVAKFQTRNNFGFFLVYTVRRSLSLLSWGVLGWTKRERLCDYGLRMGRGQKSALMTRTIGEGRKERKGESERGRERERRERTISKEL